MRLLALRLDILGKEWHRSLVELDAGLPILLEWLNSSSLIRWETVPKSIEEVIAILKRYQALVRGTSAYEQFPALKCRSMVRMSRQLKAAPQSKVFFHRRDAESAKNGL